MDIYTYDAARRCLRSGVMTKKELIQKTYTHFANGKLKREVCTTTDNTRGIRNDTILYNEKGYRISQKFDYVYGKQKPQDPDISKWNYYEDKKGIITRVDWVRTTWEKKFALREKYIFYWQF